MKRFPASLLAVLTVFGVATLAAYRTQASWPPGLQQVPDESPVLAPDAAIKTIVMPPGYRLELVASEPMVQDPVAIDWDADGRLWVVEMPGYMLDIQATGEHKTIGRVVVLEDTNDDGKMDERTVFADGLVLARSLAVLGSGVLVGEPPNVWLMKDTDGDLKADTKELVTDTYARRDANVEHNANGLFWAMDNSIYTSEVDMYLRPENGTFAVRRTLSRGQWGLSHDDAGRIYRNTNSSALYVDVVPTPYYARNPLLRRTRGSYEFLGQDGDEINITWPIRPTRGVNRGYQAGVLREDGTLASFTAVAAPTIYRGDRLPSELYGNAFLVEPSGNLVSRIIIDDDGNGLRGRKAYARGEFMASTDERFRPVNLSSAPDGTLYVVDMYRGIIQHKGYITEYLRDHILSRELEQPTGLGRIYRVLHETTRRGSAPALSKASVPQLVETLSHPNGWHRDTAQRLLVQRRLKDAVSPLQALVTSAKEPRTRIHALWTLDGMDASDPALVQRALQDPSRDVRVSAIRIAERWLREPNHPIHAAVLKLTADNDWAVRAQLAASLGELPPGAKETALADVLERHASDPVTADAALSGIHGSEAAVLDLLLRHPAEAAGRTAAVTLVASLIVAGAQDAPAQALFDRIAETDRPAWQRSALLRGAEVALLGVPAPGTPQPRGRGQGAAQDAPCPTCPGGRAGPGGAPAFPSTSASGGAGRGRGNGAGVRLKLTREPALGTLAKEPTELGTRAAAILARVEWPGKAGVVTAAALTAEEQARFNAGREVYQNLCVACHQADGRGREKMATSLVGSAFALGSPEIPVRVLINGKEGAVGLMPPLGAVLSDQQIASVLTYVRREWGNTGTAVDPETVARIRALVAKRTTPWTDSELSTLGGSR